MQASGWVPPSTAMPASHAPASLASRISQVTIEVQGEGQASWNLGSRAFKASTKQQAPHSPHLSPPRLQPFAPFRPRTSGFHPLRHVAHDHEPHSTALLQSSCTGYKPERCALRAGGPWHSSARDLSGRTLSVGDCNLFCPRERTASAKTLRSHDTCLFASTFSKHVGGRAGCLQGRWFDDRGVEVASPEGRASQQRAAFTDLQAHAACSSVHRKLEHVRSLLGERSSILNRR